MKRVIKILLTVIIFSCESNWGKYDGYRMEYGSAMEYYIVLDKGEFIKANDAKIESLRKSILIKYHRSSGVIDSVFLGKGNVVIEPFVDSEKINYDSVFILIAQKPLEGICECNDSCLKNRYPNRNDLPTYKMCKEALEKSTNYQYWIIHKAKDEVYGPYSKEEYLQKRKELGIPKELKLND